MKHTEYAGSVSVAAKYLIHKGGTLLEVAIKAWLLAVHHERFLERLLLALFIYFFN